MYNRATKPKSLRQWGILFIESLAVFIAVVVTLAYLNAQPEIAQVSDVQDAKLQMAVAEQTTTEATIDPDVVKTLAWQEVVSGNYDAAIVQYTLVLSANPHDTQAWLERGIAFARSGDHATAIHDYSAAARLDRSNALIYYNRGISYEALNMAEEALHDYDHSIRHDDQYAYTWNNRGYLYATVGQWENAIRDYSQAIELDPTYATAYNNRAIAYTNLGNLTMARSDYEIALGLNPEYIDANYNYGILMYKQGDYQAAMEAFHAVIKSNVEKTPQMWNNHGSTMHRLGQYAHAITSYTAALDLDPDYDLALLNRATAYRDLGDYQNAVEDYSALLAKNPYRYDLYLARGNALESINVASSEAATSYLQYLRRNGIFPFSLQEVTEQDYRTEFKISRNQLHQFRVYVEAGQPLDFSVISISADAVDPMIVVQKDGVIVTGNDDTDQTLNASLFDVTFETSGWVSVYVGLAGGGSDTGIIQFSLQPAK